MHSLLHHYLLCSPYLSLPFSHICPNFQSEDAHPGTSEAYILVPYLFETLFQLPSFPYLSNHFDPLRHIFSHFCISSTASLLAVLVMIASCSGAITEFAPQTGVHQYGWNPIIYQSQANMCKQRIFRLTGT